MDNTNTLPVVQTITELSALVNNLLLLLSDKEKVVVKKRFSLFGTQKYTLEEIGKEFLVTRERVRQIEKSALNKMKRNVFNTALRHLHDFALNVVKKDGGLMKEDVLLSEFDGILPSGFKVDRNSLHLALALHDDLVCIGNTIDFYPYVREKNISDYSLKYVSNNLLNQLYKYGNVKKLDKLCADLKSVLSEVNFDVQKVQSIISVDKRLTMIDGELVGLLEWRHINPRTLRDKILYILRKEKSPMHFSEIADRISDAKFDSRNVNLQAVHNELIRHEQFVLIGRGIYALQEWGYEKGTVADVIEKILREKGELSQDEIFEKVLKQRKVKKITILLSLKNNSRFERVGRRIYKFKKG